MDKLHCPNCRQKREHYHRVSGNQDVYTCTKCEHTQSYNRPKPASYEDDVYQDARHPEDHKWTRGG